MIDTVIFDMDGVLIDSEPVHQKVNLAFFSSLGITISKEFYYKNFVGLPVEQMMVYIKKEYKVDESLPSLLNRCAIQLYKAFEETELKPVEGVEELLIACLERKFKLAVGSSSSPELIKLIINKLGLTSYFQLLVSGAEVEKGKPNPDVFLKIAEKLSVKPEGCVVIEDSALGLSAACQAGMLSIGVRNASSGEQDLGLGKIVVSDFNKESRNTILTALSNW